MDLSAVIFVVLALAWAVYLIPKALQHHDEMASDRLVEGHSERVRILRRKSTPTGTVEVETEVRTETEETTHQTPRRERPELSPAGRAARKRRRVLAVLLLSLVAVAGAAYFGRLPRWSVAVPVLLIALFLVVARLTVRSAQRPSLAQRRPAPAPAPAPVRRAADEASVFDPHPVAQAETHDEVDVDLHGEPDPAVLADDGSLWDPLPLTLPTYVNKARARRTVRTIELTGMQSSGHDRDDSALARDSAVEAETETAPTEESRRVAGA